MFKWWLARKGSEMAYCMKCRQKQAFKRKAKVVMSKNGRRMAKGMCKVCGCKMATILKTKSKKA